MRRLAPLLLAVAVSACGLQAPQQEESAEPASAAAPQRDLSIGPNGAGGIGEALPMDVNLVRAAVPHFTVAQTQEAEGGAETITLSADGQEVFRLYPSDDNRHVRWIATRSALARGPADDVVGEVTFAVAPPQQVSFCEAEAVNDLPGFACSTGPGASFWRVYQLPEGYDGPSDTFEAIDPDVLHDATLAEMRWLAPD